jgi:hypothetical protein
VRRISTATSGTIGKHTEELERRCASKRVPPKGCRRLRQNVIASNAYNSQPEVLADFSVFTFQQRVIGFVTAVAVGVRDILGGKRPGPVDDDALGLLR